MSVALLIVLMPWSAGLAQDAAATVAGSVRDQLGGLVADVTVTLTGERTDDMLEARTDDRGRYEFSGVSPGDYTLSASVPGFRQHSAPVVVADLPVYHHVVLRIGEISEVITIALSGRAEEQRASQPSAPECDPGLIASGMGGRIQPPMKTRHVAPWYPEILARARVAGQATVQAVVGTDGHIRELGIVETTHEAFGQVAVASVAEWEFSPTLLNCTPVEIVMNVRMEFQ